MVCIISSNPATIQPDSQTVVQLHKVAASIFEHRRWLLSALEINHHTSVDSAVRVWELAAQSSE